MRTLLILLTFAASSPAWGTEDPASIEQNAETAEEKSTSADLRDESNLTVGYTAFSTGLILPKRGPAISYVANRKWTLELEYLEGSVGLEFKSVSFASFREELRMARARYYPGNVFNLQFGFGERRYSLDLGSDRVKDLAPEAPHVSILEVRSHVVSFGVANRWQWQPGFTVGIDWIELLIPVGGTVNAPLTDEIEDEETRDDVKKVLGILRHIPTFTAFKLHLAWTF